ncbi:zinc ion binding [Ascochyta rabiei]|uniref:Zinc ion binding n=1 Tax=Didymella rabiei TaxID=5454 RepID=A0A163C814_DIDRA|nr:zinc ion binding [Ascochyta rabiei]
MGTLTADCPRLDAHCEHKLATSCRLTSTQNCCACADERAHGLTYRVYIDGIGFVQRGTRWQGYCWFCKEFWSNRLAATDPPLDVSQTRIPEIPDQKEFLDRWFEFHQGYRIARRSDGTEQRIAVMGEPLHDVSPGFLPRTLDQLRAGIENDASRPENRLRRRRLTTESQRPMEPQQSLEDALDSLLMADSDDEVAQDVADHAVTTTVDQIVPDATDMPHPQSHDSVGPSSEAASRRQRAQERFARVFGTIEDVQQDDYESPLSNMYNRAWTRYREAEDLRAIGDSEVPPLEGLSAQERRDVEERLLWGVMRESQVGPEPESNVWSYTPISPTHNAAMTAGDVTITPPWADLPATSAPSSEPIATTLSSTGGISDVRLSLEQITSELQRLRLASEAMSSARHALHAHRTPEQPFPTLDNQPDRPPPKTDAEMTRTLACQVCYQQLADIAVLPCGHMVMCLWCADVVVPVKHSHVPIRPSKCPMCRKQIKQRFKIHIG